MPDKAVSSNDNELPNGHDGDLANLLPILLGLKNGSSKNASANFLEAWKPDGDQIELANLVIEQLTNIETIDPVGLSEEIAGALIDPAISDLLPEEDASKIVAMLNKVKLTSSTSR